jgi:protein-histidine N-methyltransferase
VSITPAVKDAFKALLESRHIQLKFTYGYWGGLASDIGSNGDKYDLVLTSETIYAEESVDDLISVLRAAHRSSEKAAKGEKVEVGLEASLGDLRLESWKSTPLASSEESVILVAAKVCDLAQVLHNGH